MQYVWTRLLTSWMSDHLSKNFAEGSDYFKLLVGVFSKHLGFELTLFWTCRSRPAAGCNDLLWTYWVFWGPYLTSLIGDWVQSFATPYTPGLSTSGLRPPEVQACGRSFRVHNCWIIRKPPWQYDLGDISRTWFADRFEQRQDQRRQRKFGIHD